MAVMGWFKKEHSNKRGKRERPKDPNTSYWDRDKFAKKWHHIVFRDFKTSSNEKFPRPMISTCKCH